MQVGEASIHSRCFQDVCRIFPGCFQDALMGLILDPKESDLNVLAWSKIKV